MLSFSSGNKCMIKFTGLYSWAQTSKCFEVAGLAESKCCVMLATLASVNMFAVLCAYLPKHFLASQALTNTTLLSSACVLTT